MSKVKVSFANKPAEFFEAERLNIEFGDLYLLTEQGEVLGVWCAGSWENAVVVDEETVLPNTVVHRKLVNGDSLQAGDLIFSRSFGSSSWVVCTDGTWMNTKSGSSDGGCDIPVYWTVYRRGQKIQEECS